MWNMSDAVHAYGVEPNAVSLILVMSCQGTCHMHLLCCAQMFPTSYQASIVHKVRMLMRYTFARDTDQRMA